MVIDVCVVSRDRSLPKGLEYVPASHLIIETSTPIGDARVAAISQVKTEVFAFIDDDVELTPDWYQKAMFHMNQGYAVVYSNPDRVGLGERFDRALSNQEEISRLMRKGERFNTNLCLISRVTVVDWRPVNRRCYEDKDLGDWLLNSGHQVLLMPTDVKHRKTWWGIAKSAMWAGREYKCVCKHSSIEYLRRVFMPVKALVTRGLLPAIFIIWRNFFMILGMLDTDVRNRFRPEAIE